MRIHQAAKRPSFYRRLKAAQDDQDTSRRPEAGAEDRDQSGLPPRPRRHGGHRRATSSSPARPGPANPPSSSSGAARPSSASPCWPRPASPP
ncbi:MAG: hypothetical protein MZV64_29010 [Ignavibacteriales bacterium]|nr:hypothetical protein [Ignavibacteriales bacterium]